MRGFVPRYRRSRRKRSRRGACCDDTLQAGDTISMDKRFLMFHGRSVQDGEDTEFVPIAPR